MEKHDDAPKDVKRATPVKLEIAKGKKDDTFEGYPRVVDKKKRWEHCDKSSSKKSKHASKSDADCCKQRKEQGKKSAKFAMVSVFDKPCAFPKLDIVPRHCLTKKKYIDVLATPSRKCPPDCNKKMVLKKLKPVSQRIKELALPTRQRMLMTLQQGAAILPAAFLDNLIRTLENETCLTPEQAALASRKKKSRKQEKGRRGKSLFSERSKPTKSRKLGKINIGVTSTGSTFDKDSVTCQYLMAERFVRSILKWKCSIPKAEFADISEVIVGRLIDTLEYAPPQDGDRKSQQLRFLADSIACWITGVLFEVAENQERKLVERCQKKEAEMKAYEEEEGEEDEDDVGGAGDEEDKGGSDYEESDEDADLIDTEEGEKDQEEEEEESKEQAEEEEEAPDVKKEIDEAEEAEAFPPAEVKEEPPEIKEEPPEIKEEPEEEIQIKVEPEPEMEEEDMTAAGATTEEETKVDVSGEEQPTEDTGAEEQPTEETEIKEEAEEEVKEEPPEEVPAELPPEPTAEQPEELTEEIKEEVEEPVVDTAEKEEELEIKEEPTPEEEVPEEKVSEEKVPPEAEIPKDVVKDLADLFKTDLPFLTFAKIIDAINKMIEGSPENKGEDPITNGIQRAIYEKLSNIVALENPDLLTDELKGVINVVCGKIANWLRSVLTKSQLELMEQFMPKVESKDIRDWTKWLEYISDVAKNWNTWLRDVIEKMFEMEGTPVTRGEWHDWTKSIDAKALLWRRYHLEIKQQARRNLIMIPGGGAVKSITGTSVNPDASEQLLLSTDLRP